MAVLKKIKSSTLMETLVATVLIVVVFMVSSLILNNTLKSTLNNSTKSINTYIKELHYLELNNKITIPYNTVFNEWSIDIFNDGNNVTIEASKKDNSKTIKKTYAKR